MWGQPWGIVGVEGEEKAQEWASLYRLSSDPKYVAESGTKRLNLAGPHVDRDFGHT
jgi:hypothetical protein